jgi:hypothetical protein
VSRAGVSRHFFGQNHAVIELTDWAKDILNRSQEAARRFNPQAKIRLSRVSGSIQASLTDQPSPDDQTVDVGGMTLYVQSGLEGLVDIEEPHDRLVLRPLGSAPNVHGEH